MNATDIEANWHQFEGFIREKFGKLTNDDVAQLNGKVENLIGKLQERYNLSLAEAESVITGLKINDSGEPELGTTIEGEGSIEASRRFQEAQHQFADENPVTKND
jgi:uncharacterized protein YjbJ (UPF0337 family)